MTTPDFEEIADQASKAREFWPGVGSIWPLATYIKHQKGLRRSGAHGKAVAVAQGWEYTKHADFSSVLNQARRLTGNAPIPEPSRQS